jgi:hypothetical protein
MQIFDTRRVQEAQVKGPLGRAYGLFRKLDVEALNLDIEVVVERRFNGFWKTERPLAATNANARSERLLLSRQQTRVEKKTKAERYASNGAN